MLDLIARNWWVYLLRGLAAVAFGAVALFWPGIALGALILLFAVYALTDGVLSIGGLLVGARIGPWWAHLLMGLLSIAAGVIALVSPGVTAIVLLFVIASWAIANGILGLYTAIRYSKILTNEWMLGLSSVLAIAFGVVLLLSPGAGILSLVWLLGIFAVAWGVSLVVFAFRVRNLRG